MAATGSAIADAVVCAQTSLDAILAQARKLAELKKQGESAEGMRASVQAAILEFAEARSTMRRVHLLAAKADAGARELRGASDTAALDVLALSSESHHFKDQIRDCESFQTRTLAALEASMEPRDVFEGAVPPSARPASEAADPHAYALARLAHEKAVRETLQAELSSLEEERKVAQERAASLSSFLLGLPDQVRRLQQEAAPLTRHLGPADEDLDAARA